MDGKTRVISRREELPAAAAALRLGGLVAVPTETVYGLCVNGLDSEAVARLYEVKGRPEIKPLSLMVAGPSDLRRYARDIPPAAFVLARTFWPGPLTLVLPAKSLVPSIVRAGGATVGLRCPDHPLTLALLDEMRLPLAGPSANPSGQPSPKTAQKVLEYFDGRIDAVVDGGACGIGTESTVLDLASLPFRILRPGALSREAIQAAFRRGLQVIGVTGGTGTGKTTFTEYLAGRGALALDCDAIYHELLESSEPMLRELRESFPAAFSGESLDRKALGRLVFADGAALQRLNAVTHRYVTREVNRRLDEFVWTGGVTAVIDAVGLFESGLDGLCTATVGVLAQEETRLSRIMAREGIPRDYALARIRAQQPDGFYEERCDYLLRNDGDLEDFLSQCKKMLNL